MKTEQRFQIALRELMEQKPLDEINVASLCELCSCHRQTFYYHYQDIYDLLAEIYLNEKVPGLESATSVEDVLWRFLDYSKENAAFLKATFQSAGRDLIAEFYYAKIYGKTFIFLQNERYGVLDIEQSRSVARRFAKLASEEFLTAFKDPKLSKGRLEKRLSPFLRLAEQYVLTPLIQLAKQESKL